VVQQNGDDIKRGTKWDNTRKNRSNEKRESWKCHAEKKRV